MTKRHRRTPPPTPYIDIHLEFSLPVLQIDKDPVRTVAEASRHAATEAAEAAGATLTEDLPIDVNTATATTPTGFDVVLVASRWRINP